MIRGNAERTNTCKCLKITGNGCYRKKIIEARHNMSVCFAMIIIHISDQKIKLWGPIFKTKKGDYSGDVHILCWFIRIECHHKHLGRSLLI